MNLGELRSDLAMTLNFNTGQVNQDFTDAQLNTALNRAYAREVQFASSEGTRRYFAAVLNITWPANQLTLTLPPALQGKTLTRFADVTHGEPGREINFSEFGVGSGIFWLDANTLQFGTTAPGQDRTFRVFYYAAPNTLVLDADVPNLVPTAFHELLVWSAAIWLRAMADEAAPQAWVAQRDELRMNYWKLVGRGRPTDDVPWVRPRESDVTDSVFYY